ncbi:MAG: hypothetical protein ACJ72Z_06205 [Pyrinomonadaceae bacterium]
MSCLFTNGAKFSILLILWLSVSAYSQKIVDKTVATISDGIRTELITLSDLRWQLALQKGINLNPPSSDDLNAALRLLVDQRIFTLEANRLPREAVSEKEIAAKIKEILDANRVTAVEFESRLRQVGFSSVNDENFEKIIADRVAIDKYLAFRFRSFIVITANDEAKYYRDVFVPDFRRRYPGLLMPALEEKRAEIHETLIEQRVAADIETFLEDAKQRVSVVYISPV